MTVDPLGPVLARAEHRLLAQFLVTCPGCGRPAAAHVDVDAIPLGGQPVVVRLVCPDGCVVADDAVLAQLPVGQMGATA